MSCVADVMNSLIIQTFSIFIAVKQNINCNLTSFLYQTNTNWLLQNIYDKTIKTTISFYICLFLLKTTHTHIHPNTHTQNARIQKTNVKSNNFFQTCPHEQPQKTNQNQTTYKPTQSQRKTHSTFNSISNSKSKTINQHRCWHSTNPIDSTNRN